MYVTPNIRDSKSSKSRHHYDNTIFRCFHTTDEIRVLSYGEYRTVCSVCPRAANLPNRTGLGSIRIQHQLSKTTIATHLRDYNLYPRRNKNKQQQCNVVMVERTIVTRHMRYTLFGSFHTTIQSNKHHNQPFIKNYPQQPRTYGW
jgi:hypothetical protein